MSPSDVFFLIHNRNALGWLMNAAMKFLISDGLSMIMSKTPGAAGHGSSTSF